MRTHSFLCIEDKGKIKIRSWIFVDILFVSRYIREDGGDTAGEASHS